MSSRMRRIAVLIAVVVAAAGFRAQAEEFFFKDGDTVVIIGDSITEQHLYSNYVEMWTVSRFPKWNLTFRNSGIGGDSSGGGNGRFKRDVVVHKATAMTVDFGMNDGGYKAFEEGRYKTYMKGLQGMADQAKAANIRVAWATPSPVEKAEDGPALQGYNETLEKYSAGVAEIAQKSQGVFVDQFHPFVALQDKARAENPKNRIGGGDAVHPGPAGQTVMAWAILKGLHFPPLVSSAEVDAAGNKVVKAEKCEVTNVAAKDGGISFQRLDAALPFFPKEAKAILKWAPIDQELNQYALKVTGLKEGQYDILVDTQKIGEHTAAELAAGVNLAGEALAGGPIADHVKAVWSAVAEKNRYYHDKIFRGMVLGAGAVPDWLEIPAAEIEAKKQAAMEKRMAKMPELDAAVRKSLEMKPHQFDIVPAKK
ncbi:MAG: SGNH/GDSL hydrolase family protein [Planctomycetota bacterium]|nr:SGNH/GDSL hydrolase family protein [Planctomycetota bacterium]